MISLKTKYLGLTLTSPIIISSSGLTNSAEKIEKLANAGAGAVILKSLFEEQIYAEVDSILNTPEGDYPEASGYVTSYVKSNSISQYLELIKTAKTKVKIPIIASINCYSHGDWSDFAHSIEKAGADAIELNLFLMNTGQYESPLDYENHHYAIVKSVKKATKLPIAVKISPYFSNIVTVIEKLKASGADAVTLFNRFYNPDIDIHQLKSTAGVAFSSAADIYQTLRWTAIVSGKTNAIEISASTGVHDWEAVVKLILSGATTVQICSLIYNKGANVIPEILTCIEEWMSQKGFKNLDDFRGSMNYKNIKDNAHFERAQFMKYFSARE